MQQSGARSAPGDLSGAFGAGRWPYKLLFSLGRSIEKNLPGAYQALHAILNQQMVFNFWKSEKVSIIRGNSIPSVT